MTPNTRDTSILRHILRYCEEAEGNVKQFGDSLEQFSESYIYQNACCMCILQFGELAGLLSDDFRAAHTEIPWKSVRGMRNIFAHNYGNISLPATWETITDDIPALKQFCLCVLKP